MKKKGAFLSTASLGHMLLCNVICVFDTRVWADDKYILTP